MDWDKIRIFHAVAEAGSFTQAGTTLNLSQSAVSRQISTLEGDLKVPLFLRHARGLILTEQGELLYRTAHDMFAQVASAKARLTDSKEKPFGELTVTTTIGLGSIWLTPRIAEFLELYPSITVNLSLEDRELNLDMREADVAIRLRRPVQPDLIQRKLFTVHFHVYASPSYLERFGTPKDLADLDHHKLVVSGLKMPGYFKDINLLETAGLPAGKTRAVAFRVNNVYGQRRAAETGAGIAILPDYLVNETVNLVRILPDVTIPDFDTYFVYPEELRNSKRVNVFRDFIVAKARQWSS